MPTKPTLETCAELYGAALDRIDSGHLAMQRVLESAAKHGYTEQQMLAWLSERRVKE